MATKYFITLGFSEDGDTARNWLELLLAVNQVRKNPSFIAAEALGYGCPMTDEEGLSIESYAKLYAKGNKKTGTPDKTLRIYGDAKEPRERFIVQSASGNGESRRMKEALRRAFCRLVMCKMHELEIDINIRVQ